MRSYRSAATMPYNDKLEAMVIWSLNDIAAAVRNIVGPQ